VKGSVEEVNRTGRQPSRPENEKEGAFRPAALFALDSAGPVRRIALGGPFGPARHPETEDLMGRADPLAPFIDHLGAFVGTLCSPVAIVLVALLALCAPERRLYMAGAAVIGCLDVLAGGIGTGAPGEIAVACLPGALATLTQAWLFSPMRGLVGMVRSLLHAGRGYARTGLPHVLHYRRRPGRNPDGPPKS
jgi:hypothetical protein